MNDLTEYTPGVCNLGRDEIRKRYRMGWIGLSVLIVMVAFILISKPDRFFRIGVAIPVFYSLSGFIQAHFRFCYVYGFTGVFSTRALRQVSRVYDASYRKQDRRKAFMIVAVITLLTILITMIFYWV